MFNFKEHFENLYESHAGDVYRYTLWLSGDTHEAEDITAETFVRVWVRRNTVRTETLKAYLFTIARNLFLERQRKKRRHVTLDDTVPDPTPGPDKQFESQHDLERVQTILHTVPETDRSAFVLRVQHGLTYAEIARVLRLPTATVRVKVHRARRRILTTFSEQEVSKP